MFVLTDAIQLSGFAKLQIICKEANCVDEDNFDVSSIENKIFVLNTVQIYHNHALRLMG